MGKKGTPSKLLPALDDGIYRPSRRSRKKRAEAAGGCMCRGLVGKGIWNKRVSVFLFIIIIIITSHPIPSC